MNKYQFGYQKYRLRILLSVVLLPIAYVILNFFSMVFKNNTLFSLFSAIVLVGLLYCYFKFSECIPFFLGTGDYWTEGNAVCITVGKRTYRMTDVTEIRGYTTTIALSKTSVLRIRYNRRILKLYSAPMSGESDFGRSDLYYLWDTIKVFFPELKPQMDPLNSEIKYYCRVSGRKN